MTLGRNHVLVYHKVDYQREIGISVVSPQQFRRQIELLLKQSFKIGPLRNLNCPANPLEKQIALTFDDGYADIFQYAYPTLEELGIAGTIFLISGFLGRSNRWDVNLGGIRFPHLDCSQVAELVAAGWEVGSHTVHHRCLIGMTDAQMIRELSESKQFLEDRFGRRVRFLAAPFGKVNRRIIDLSREVGYEAVCGFFPFRYQKEAPPPGFIPRLAVYASDSLAAVERKLSQGYRLRLEVTKQNVINFCANGTLLAQALR